MTWCEASLPHVQEKLELLVLLFEDSILLHQGLAIGLDSLRVLHQVEVFGPFLAKLGLRLGSATDVFEFLMSLIKIERL